MWDFRDDVTPSGRGLVGYEVEAIDGHIGTVDEDSDEAGNAFIVVDTGHWIFGRKRLLPAGAVRQVDEAGRKVWVGLTKDQIERGPDFEDAHRQRVDDESYSFYGQHIV